MVTADNIYYFRDKEEVLICCDACKTVVARIPFSVQWKIEGHEPELEEQLRTVKDLHLAKCAR